MLRVVIIKPSKYGMTGYVERFRRGFMPNSTVPYIRSMTPAAIEGVTIETHAVDEYVQDRKSTRLNSSHLGISYAVFCLKKKKPEQKMPTHSRERIGKH